MPEVLIMKVERDEILEELLSVYIDAKLKKDDSETVICVEENAGYP